MAQIRTTNLDLLRSRVTGTVAEPGSPGYSDAVAIWNGAIDRHPAVVVRCAGSADVSQALAFAQDHDLEVSVRGGGHGFAGFAVTDGGVMIDLTPLKSVRVDPVGQVAVAGGGVTWAEDQGTIRPRQRLSPQSQHSARPGFLDSPRQPG